VRSRDGARGIISFGIAGGLVENIGAGGSLIGRAIVSGESRWQCDAAWMTVLGARLPAQSSPISPASTLR
jgi:hypothetical protein